MTTPRPMIDWPVKTSLRRYVQALADGAIDAWDGAAVTPESFQWPAIEDAATGDLRRFRASGTVRFDGHGHLLVIGLTNPTVELEGSTGTLWIDYPWAGESTQDQIVIARLEAAPDGSSYAVFLSDDGAELFNTYAAGAEMAPLRILPG